MDKRDAFDCEICGCYTNPPATIGDPYTHRTRKDCLDAIDRELGVLNKRLSELNIRRHVIAQWSQLEAIRRG